MFKKLKNNPILIHQMRQARWPSLRTAVWIAVGLAVFWLLWILFPYLIAPGQRSWVDTSLQVSNSSFLVTLYGLFLLAFGPFLTVVVSANITMQVISAEAYQMVQIGQDTARSIVNGLISGVVYRLRALWMIAGGLSIPWFVAVILLRTAFNITNTCIVLVDIAACSETILQRAEAVLIVSIYYLMLFVTMNWLAGILGVWLVLQYHTIGKALVWAIAALVLVLPLQNSLFGCTFAADDWSWQWIREMVVFAGINTSLGWLAYRLAVRCAGSMRE